MWYLIGVVVRDPRNGAVLEVEEVKDGNLVRHKEKDKVVSGGVHSEEL